MRFARITIIRSSKPARDDIKLVHVPANALGHELGNDRVLNMVMLGAVVSSTAIVSKKALAQAVETVLNGKKRSLIDVNLKALEDGAKHVSTLK